MKGPHGRGARKAVGGMRNPPSPDEGRIMPSADPPYPPNIPPRSVRHQYRQGGTGQDVARGAAEDHLAQAALSVGALDEEVAAERLCDRQDSLAGRAALEADRQQLGVEAVALQ